MKCAISKLNHCKLTCPILIFSSDLLLDLPTSPLAYILTTILHVIGYISQFYDNVILKHSSRNLFSKRTLDLRPYLYELYQNSFIEVGFETKERVAVITVAEKIVQ